MEMFQCSNGMVKMVEKVMSFRWVQVESLDGEEDCWLVDGVRFCFVKDNMESWVLLL